MASVALSHRVGRVVGYPPLSELGDLERREFHEALLEAVTFEDLLYRTTTLAVSSGSCTWPRPRPGCAKAS
jgi:hypothetical protein